MSKDIWTLKDEIAEAQKALEAKRQELEKAQASIKQDAIAKIAQFTKTAYEALGNAELLANEAGVSFDFSVEYGMGGTYYGNPDDNYYNKRQGWQSSSSSC